MLLSYIERLRLVGMIGFIVDLAALGQKPVLTESFGTIVTGAMAVVLHLLVSRLTDSWNPSTVRVAREFHLLVRRPRWVFAKHFSGR